MGCAHNIPYGYVIQRDVFQLNCVMYSMSVYLVWFVNFIVF